jgi:hypothetical protein
MFRGRRLVMSTISLDVAEINFGLAHVNTRIKTMFQKLSTM